MGRIVNPSNDGFAEILTYGYVDKTGLITEFDSTLGTTRKLVLSTRPRRFGKSFAALALCAFYSCGCNSKALFEGLAVSEREGWDQNLNAYNVVRLDMCEVIEQAKTVSAKGEDKSPWQALVVPVATDWIMEELLGLAPDDRTRAGMATSNLTSAILQAVTVTGRKFVFVIDEWDAPYRLAEGEERFQDAYADWLRSLFKGGTFTPEAVAGAYLTGILPIRKYAHQSAVSDFREFTMLDPGPYAPYVGFTETEVLALCDEAALDAAEVRRWYDGYTLRYMAVFEDGPARATEVRTFAPYSVMRACESRRVKSYWPSSEAFRSLLDYIELDLDGLQARVAAALGGADVPVNVNSFRGDLTRLVSADSVLTLLAHLGYLAYDEGPHDEGTVRVPNEEVRGELSLAFSESRHPLLRRMSRDSITLLEDIVSGRADRVAAGIGAVHDRDCAPLFYNEEHALRAVVKGALMAAVDYYLRVEEMPGGRGYADVVYVPKPASGYPALVVELKWDRPAETAIAQIRKRGYFEPLEGIGAPVLLVGITYNSQTKEHSCVIEELVR